MRYVLTYWLLYGLGIVQALGQEYRNVLIGKFDNPAISKGQKVVLISCQGKSPQGIDTTVVADDGSFQLSYPKTYTGMSLMQLVGTQGEIPLLLLGDSPTIQSLSLKNGQLEFSEGSPNAVYYAYKQNSDKFKQQLELLGKLSAHYEAKSSFGQSLAAEQKLTAAADAKLTNDIGSLNNDVGYFLRLDQSLSSMNILLGGNTPPSVEKLKAAQAYFEEVVNFTDERLWHSGILHRLVYSYYSLSSVLEGGHQHAGDFLAARLAGSPYKNNYLEEIIGIVQGQPAMAEYFSQKMLAVNEQCDDINGKDMAGKIKRQLEQYSLLKIGSQAPDELLQNGKRISELSGDYKLIVFWASWCEHCQKEIPELRAMYADLKKQDIEVVAMGMDDNAEIHKIVSQVNPWVSHFVGRDWNAPVTQHYRVFGTPTYFLVDKDMKIVARPKSVDEVAQWINRNKT